MLSPNGYVEVLEPIVSQIVTFFKNKAFTEEIKLEWAPPSGPSCNMIGVLTKWGDLDTDTQGECLVKTKEGTDKGGAFTSPGSPKIARKPPEARREACNRVFTALRRNQSH